jgi:hypothetical protein
LLTVSFPYVRDWLNEHPFKNEPNARLICNLHNGAPIKPEALQTKTGQLKRRILRTLTFILLKNIIKNLLHICCRKYFTKLVIWNKSLRFGKLLIRRKDCITILIFLVRPTWWRLYCKN